MAASYDQMQELANLLLSTAKNQLKSIDLQDPLRSKLKRTLKILNPRKPPSKPSQEALDTLDEINMEPEDFDYFI